MYRILILSVLLVCFGSAFSQTKTQAPAPPAKPKLIVGMVVDQMRWDFLYRYQEKYVAGGFKRLLREGYSCESTHINYSPSYTACGHSCVYTGSVPAIHGITGNAWYDLGEKKMVANVEDTTQKTIGSGSKTGMVSPNRLMTTTITDELRLSNNFKSKVVGIALKDRGAILPAGHTANAAYFYDGSSGNWVTSSYYGMKELPQWVKSFNDQKLPEKYVTQNWNTLKPIAEYWESHGDDETFEQPFKNETRPVFEHKVGELFKTNMGIISATPYGNTFTLDLAKAAIVGESLGKGNYTDFLAVSLSSTDYVGHQFGPNSIEVEDCYLRLDKDLESFFNSLDQTIGKGNYLVFLTADHGVAHVPGFMQQKQIPAGVFDMDTAMKQLEAQLDNQFGASDWLLAFENMQIYLNNTLIDQQKKDKAAIKKVIKDFLLPQRGIANVLDLENLPAENVEASLKQAISNGVYQRRSGDLYVLFQPGWFEGMPKGTTHGTVYPYDTHIPLVWMGWKVKPGLDNTDVHMTDISPTIAAMLHIQEPSGCVGKVIQGLVKH